MRLLSRIFLSLLTVVSLFSLPLAGAAAGVLPERGSFFSVQSRQSETISEGVVMLEYTLELSDGQVRLVVLQVDLKNPYIKIESLLGANNTLDSTQQVSKMAERSGAVAAINSGFFIMTQGKPLGMVVRDGELIASPNMRNDMPAFALSMDKQPLMNFFQFSGEVKAGNGSVFPLYGVNKLLYNMEDGSLSDTNRLNLYNRNWGEYSRGGLDTLFPDVVETVVQNNIVTKQVVSGDPLQIPANGYVLWGHGDAAKFMLENMKVGKSVKLTYNTTPDYKKLKLSAGSNSFLVQNGAVSPFQEELKGKNSRTAVAASDNGRYLYLVAVEKSDQSRGLEQRELAQLLVAMGAEMALNLDGGGSTTMVAKRLGESWLTNIVQPSGGWQRPVTDSLGIFSTAPRGAPSGLVVDGPGFVLAGTDNNNYTVKGYDSHFYPWQPTSLNWQAVGDGDVVNGVFTAGSGGDVNIEVTSGTVKGTKTVHVIGAGEIKGLRVEPAAIKADSNQPVILTFSVETKDGQIWPLETRYVTIQATTGTVSGGVFTPPGPDGSRGVLEATYQGLTVQIPVYTDSMFNDTEDNWADEQINELAALGIIKGYEDGTYRPDEPVTRAQLVSLLARLFQWPSVGTQFYFEDSVPEWAQEAVNAAVAQGVVSGYPDRTFLPNRPVTRAEVSVILDRAIKFPAVNAGLLFDDTAIPGADEELDFIDAGSIPDWATASMSKVVSAGIMRGYEDGTIKPGANLTRAEIAALIKRLIESKYVKVEQ